MKESERKVECGESEVGMLQEEEERGKERRVLSVRNVARAGACPVVTCCPSLA